MKERSLHKAGILYLCVGVINTCVGYGIIFALIWCGLVPEVANVLGYIVGFIVSYFLNKTFTFASSSSHKRDLPRFAISMGVAYIVQLLAMMLSYRIFEWNVYLCQIVGGAFYVAVGFAMSRFWAFKKPKQPDSINADSIN
ncbi:GtrA family protein [Helicobacter jaachi]|uniref:GtrA family protein n=1 Tax=Helicobacter jaachi TaxID=1677920 RepID=A0A4U8T7C1_9HELI|nr:GtrA family protein [Helicobacter jaachi]TLD95473.1 GtrA family protein [Helicobacter jaachi]